MKTAGWSRTIRDPGAGSRGPWPVTSGQYDERGNPRSGILGPRNCRVIGDLYFVV